MASISDYYNCNFGDFTKLVQSISGSKETEYEKMIEQLNIKYIELSKEIMGLNEKRIEHLNKIKYAQTEYRKLLGEGEITVSVDIDDNSDSDEKVIVESKPGVRGRKKKEKVELVPVAEDLIDDVELDDVESNIKLKSKSKSKHVDLDEEDLGSDNSEEEEVKKSTKKAISKKSTKEEVKVSKKSTKEEVVEEVKPVKTSKKSAKEVVEDVKPAKTSKKSAKEVVEEPIEEPIEEETKPKKSTKGTKPKK
jgi:hypothetical protein